ncbi:MAG: class I SAM-dependent methyltransferase [Bacteroidales bacterium]|nr:class I SAM-dependent methyltransferase [Bacteroidales bacterium]
MKMINHGLRYLRYLRNATNAFKVHSPFIYEVYTKAIQDNTTYEDYKKVESMRKELLTNNNPIEVIDFGAGAQERHYKSSLKRISEIAKKTASTPKNGQTLYRLIKYFKPQTMLELGTSIGISTAYQALAAPESKIHCIEGAANAAAKAEENLKYLGLKNFRIEIGNFDALLPKILKTIDKLDYVFFDGNHRKEPTLNYFNQCAEKAHNNSVFVLDDIHWSKGMEEAWEHIQQDERVTATIDLFFLGIIFFKKELSKEHFILKY